MPTQYPISRYLNVRQAYGPSFSSDGRRLAFVTNTTGLPQVWQVPLAPDTEQVLWPEQLTFEADRVAGAEYSPAPGDGRLVYARDAGGNERMQLYLLEADGVTTHCLTEGHEDAMHIPGGWSGNGQSMLFAANRRHPGLFDLYLQSLPVEGHPERGPGSDVKGHLVWQNDQPGYLRNQELSADGGRAIVTRVASSFSHELFEVDLAEGTARHLPLDRLGVPRDGLGVPRDGLGAPGAEAEHVRIAACHYTPDGRSLLLITDAGSDLLYLARLDLESGELETLVAPDWDCEAMCVSPDGTRVAYAVNVKGVAQLYLLDLTSGETRAAPSPEDGPGVVAESRLTFSRDGRYVAFAYTSSTRTADVYLWDLVNDRVRAVTRASHGGLPRTSFVAPELIHYPTFDLLSPLQGERREIPAWFYRPAGESSQPRPAVVIVHGGPEGQYRPGFDPIAQYLAHNGYAVLAPNVRGSVGYGKAYSHLDDVEKRMDSVADLAHAAQWLKRQPGIDGARIAVYGGSYGGFMVLSALTAYPELWAAGVDIVGISNLATFLENTSDYRRAHRESEYGSLARDRAFLERIAPIRHVDRLVAPLLVIHGANDPRVPVSEAEQLVAALRAREVPVELIVFEDEGHGVVKLHNKLVAYPAIVAFLDQHLCAD